MVPCKENIDPAEEKAKIQTSIIQSHGLVGVGDISLTSVAKRKPITRKQYEEASTYWPTHFHENKRYDLSLLSTELNATTAYITVEPLNKGRLGNNINTLVLSFVCSKVFYTVSLFRRVPN